MEQAVSDVLAAGKFTGDLADKGAPSLSTSQMGDAIVAALKANA